MSHLLDRPIWSTLNTHHSKFAIGGKGARRFAPNISPLASACDDSSESLMELAELVPIVGTLILLQVDPIVVPPGVDALTTATGVQMVLDHLTPVADVTCQEQIQRLTDDDIPAMLELAILTKPGPFETGTSSLGEFCGIKRDGQLVAMAGERMKMPGYSEVSGVCSHPSARGRGYARVLSATVAKRIVARGDIPFLHAYAANTAAIQLYETLGFSIRCNVNVAVLSRSPGQN